MWVPLVIAVVGAAGVGALALAAASRPRRAYRRVLVAGDSLVASPDFTSALRQLLEAKNDSSVSVDNVAVVGRGSGDILRQVQENATGHDLVVVSAGTNDRELLRTQLNLREIVSTARSAGADVALFTEPPLRGYRGSDAAEIERSESSRRWVLGGGAGARYVVDLHRVLGDSSRAGFIRSDLSGGDGLHPNRAGRVEMARAIARSV